VRRRAIAAAAVLVASLGIAACGSSSSDTTIGEIGGDYGQFFGIAPSLAPNDADFARMAAGGIGSYHVLLSWPSVEAKPGTYNWDKYDALFKQLATYGIEPVPYVYGTPAAYGNAGNEAPTESGKTLDAWERFLKAAVTRYGPNGQYWRVLHVAEPDLKPQPVRVWEIWNEPNSSVFWTPKPDPDAYAELFLRSSEAIKSVDPQAQVMTAGMFITPQSDNAIKSTDFLAQVYENEGLADAIDVVGIHPYGPTVGDVMDQVDATHQVVEDAGDDASTWVTEIGWGSDPESGAQLAETPEKQAELLTKSYEALLGERDTIGLEGIIWYTWHDGSTGASCGWCPSAGLLDADRDAKPAWDAFTEISGGTP
jgi:hypothetical protein